MKNVRLAVIGGGLSGMAAALTGAASATSTVLLDERRTLGGAVLGEPNSAPAERYAWLNPPIGATHDERIQAQDLVTKLAQSEVKVELQAFVWGIFAEEGRYRIAYSQGGCTRSLMADSIVLATGRYPVGYPIRGFELRGVVYPGQFYAYLRDGTCRPDQHFVMYGSSPQAAGLVDEARARGLTLTAWLLDPVETCKVAQSHEARCWTVAGRPEALDDGQGALRAVSFRCSDADREQDVAADWLVLACPQAAAYELAALLGAEMRWSGWGLGYVPRRDDKLRTSVPRVAVCGTLIGYESPSARIASGQLAASSLCESERSVQLEQVSFLDDPQLGESDTLPPNSFYENLTMEDPAHPICPCANHMLGEVATAIHLGCRTLDDLKRTSGAGMGLCQSRICQRSMLYLMKELAGLAPANLSPMRVRPPVGPLPARAMYEEETA